MSKYPNNLKYTKDHEWAEFKGNNATVGITDHAQNALGDIVYVELPAVGKTLKKGESFGVVESVKAVSELYSPMDGKVTAVNDELKNDPSLINRSPHEKAWMIKLDASPSAISDLLDAEAYSKFVSSL